LSAAVSRRHCVLRIDNGSVNVEDLDSVNGTFINGQRVVGKQVLRPGDRLEIGPLQFMVEYETGRRTHEALSEQCSDIVLAAEDSDAIVIGSEEEDADVLPVAEQ